MADRDAIAVTTAGKKLMRFQRRFLFAPDGRHPQE
jgi:hypothetical protein